MPNTRIAPNSYILMALWTSPADGWSKPMHVTWSMFYLGKANNWLAAILSDPALLSLSCNDEIAGCGWIRFSPTMLYLVWQLNSMQAFEIILARNAAWLKQFLSAACTTVNHGGTSRIINVCFLLSFPSKEQKLLHWKMAILATRPQITKKLCMSKCLTGFFGNKTWMDSFPNMRSKWGIPLKLKHCWNKDTYH